MIGVKLAHFFCKNIHSDILLLGIISLQHVIQNNCPVGLMVLSDGIVHFRKIKKKFNLSTKTILWL